MTTAASLAHLLGIQSDITFYTQQQVYWSNLYESNMAKLSEQQKLEEKWTQAYDDAQDYDKTCKIGNTVYKNKDEVLSDAMAEAYADAKVTHYNEELMLDLEEKDMLYDTMQTMYNTMLEELRAQEDPAKQLTSNNAQNTHLLQ